MTHRQLQAEPTAQSLGFHMPAEWEPAERAWVTWPDNQETWPGCLDAAQQQFADLISQLRPHVEPCTTQSVNIPTNDSWIRDYGPVFVIDQDGHLACHDFTFNCWGRKYEPYDDDDRAPRHIAKHLGVPFWIQPMVLEGGSIDVNGAGTVMTTRQCLLESRRNPGRSQAWIQQQLHHALGTVHVVWLPGGITGDDTDGHVDDVARFINPTTVAAVRAPRGHPDHAVLEQNWRSLNEACDQDGVKLDLLELPCPILSITPTRPTKPVPVAAVNCRPVTPISLLPIKRCLCPSLANTRTIPLCVAWTTRCLATARSVCVVNTWWRAWEPSTA